MSIRYGNHLAQTMQHYISRARLSGSPITVFRGHIQQLAFCALPLHHA
jgi:hypothetical protein